MAFKIDDIEFNNLGILSLNESAEIRKRSDSGFSTVTGTRIQNIIGTFLNYTIKIDFKRYDLAERNKLYNILISPVEFHKFNLPHNGAWREFYGYIDNEISNDLDRMITQQEWGAITLSIKARDKYVG